MKNDLKAMFISDKKMTCSNHNGLVKNYDFILGTDEAGRGPAAGGVFAAAVCFIKTDSALISKLSKLNDSKQISQKTREELYPVIAENTLYHIAQVDEKKVDKINILNATFLAMKTCCENVIAQLPNKNCLTLVDGNRLIRNYNHPQQYVIKGDCKSASIAAASILAKVSRDHYMISLHQKYPEYRWDKNKGYLTKDHIDAIKKYGASPLHRMSFLKNILGEKIEKNALKIENSTEQISLF